MIKSTLWGGVAALVGCLLPPILGAAEVGYDEERAAAFESAPLVMKIKNLRPIANWINGEDRFWVKDESLEGHRFIVVDVATGEKADAFDHKKLAAALTAAGLEDANAVALPLQSIAFTAEGLVVNGATAAFRCKADASACEKSELEKPSMTEFPSPDGKTIAFLRDHNVWLRDVKSGRETALSEDGVATFAYGDPGFDLSRVQRRRNGTEKPAMGINWSPDSRYIATLRIDMRDAPRRAFIVEHFPPDKPFTVVHMDRAVVAEEKFRYPREMAVFDTRRGTKVTTDLAGSQLEDFAAMHFFLGNLWWSLDAHQLSVVTANMGGTEYGLAAVDMGSGKVRQILRESEEHYYAFTARDYHAPAFHVTADGREAIWYSQRSGAGQLYLYNARSGKLKNPITGTKGVVFDLIRVDEDRREIYFTAGGREPGRNPYHTQLYKVSFDGGDATLLTPEDAVHDFDRFTLPVGALGQSLSRFSPSGEYVVDVYSTITQPPVMVIRDRNGTKISEVLHADISELEATGWRPAERFVVKAADGKTDLYGAMIKPIEFDPSLKYPVIDQTYPGPQTDSGPQSFLDNFFAITTRNAQAMAETGAIVVTVDGRGTTRRSRDFRYAFAGTEDIFGAGDHKAAIENLAKKYPYVDATRVGITGASFGGFGSLRAALLYPEFFDVVVAHVGPNEYRNSVTAALSVERFFGVPGTDRDHYDESDSLAIMDRLEAELMLVYGEIDENVPFRSAMSTFEALIKADKDFTSYVVPNANHGGAAGDSYIVKRQRRFFRQHLGGPVPR